jgi:hypothetical protein
MTEKPTLLTDEQRQMLETLASMILPSDEFDDGLEGVGFAGIIETRNMYQFWMARLYDVGLKGINQISDELFGRRFLDLSEDERRAVLDALSSENPPGNVWTEREGALDFYINLRQDACFVYCTDAELWKRIGFPGPAFEKGGYPDFSEPQG